ncbi:protozoan/cyanobacterial globin family protein [Sphingobacterium spiritivorum ATCC 33300]|uniref:Protozoan/cyanobacterial globin family protein n=1 Tax=Sphingobacterium spiritivorum ATCC 33300 TaxID=525372 RepID=C2FYK0_SPHSI|nr:group III truncated hemoglobin [Sphingobacterium spiritivorum]EEI92020.1 protozoan/cyanobacterial globin family protein [Sphingobacterium spiritivorum ATCC 33300]QQS96508.1 group III truncated hemoglobin [Sphingobacterium spiritivorum]
MAKQDIRTLEDVKLLVNTFYGRVQKDTLIGPIFNAILDGRWEAHLEKMYGFWQTLLLDQHSYFGSPFPPHATLPVEADHFDAWLNLWTNTVREFFEGEKAEEAILRGEKMATMFLSKIMYYRNTNARPLS